MVGFKSIPRVTLKCACAIHSELVTRLISDLFVACTVSEAMGC